MRSASSRLSSLRGVAAVGLAALVAAGCSSSGGNPSSSGAPSSPTGTTSAGTPAPAVNPFTGLAPSKNPVIAVKVEDTADARPQVGLDQADIVYIEQVEGGLTRLVAVFDTHLPTTVGPVRSTRNDDPEIVAQYGPIIYVASGGSPVEYIPLDRSNLKRVINDRGGPGFSRNDNRVAPHNLFTDLAAVAKAVTGPQAKNIGLNWSKTVQNPTRPGQVVDTQVGGTPVSFHWDGKMQRYVRYFEGGVDRTASGTPISTPNVIVQFVKGNPYPRDIDPAGNPAWYQHTVGTGRVVVFRDGRRIEGRWNRPKATDGTDLVDARGKPIALAPGGAWFVLVNNGGPLAG